MAVRIGSAAYKLTLDANEFKKGATMSRKEAGQVRRTLNEMRTPAEKLAQRYDSMTKAYKDGSISAAQYERYLSKLNAEANKGNRIASKSTSVWKKFSGALKAGPIAGIAASLIAAATAALSLRAAIRSVTSAMERIDEIGKRSAALGIDAAELGGLQFAGGLSGITSQELDKGLANMTRRISEVAGGTGEATRAFEAMGLSGQKMAQMTPTDALAELAEGMSRLPNRADQVRYAMDIFGRSGVKFVNLLDEGAEGIQRMRNDADELGITFSSLDAARVEAANDAISRAKQAVGGLATTFAIEASDSIEGFANLLTKTFVEGRKEINSTKDSAEAFSDMIADATATTLDWAQAMSKLSPIMMAKDIKRWLDNDEIDNALLGKTWGEQFMTERLEARQRQLAAVQKKTRETAVNTEDIDAEDELKGKIEQTTSALRDQIFTLRHGAEALEIYKLRQEGADDAQVAQYRSLKKQIRGLEYLREKEDERRKAIEEQRQQREKAAEQARVKREREAERARKRSADERRKRYEEARKQADATISAEEQLANRMRELNAWRKAEWINELEFLRLKRKAAEELAKPIKINASVIEAQDATSKQAVLDWMDAVQKNRMDAAQTIQERAPVWLPPEQQGLVNYMTGNQAMGGFRPVSDDERRRRAERERASQQAQMYAEWQHAMQPTTALRNRGLPTERTEELLQAMQAVEANTRQMAERGPVEIQQAEI